MPPLFQDVALPLELLSEPEGFEAGDVRYLDLGDLQFAAVTRHGDQQEEREEAWREQVAIADLKSHLDVRVSWRYVTGHSRRGKRLKEQRGELRIIWQAIREGTVER